MIETKTVLIALGNLLGGGLILLGITQVGEDGWRRDAVYFLGIVWLLLKLVSAFFDILKKKYRMKMTALLTDNAKTAN
jgi:hypothetical protein